MGNYKKYTYTSLVDVDTAIFDSDELNCIRNTLEKIGHMGASQISAYSHGDMPWQAADYNEEIEPELFFIETPNML